jgi:hypothetical protein
MDAERFEPAGSWKPFDGRRPPHTRPDKEPTGQELDHLGGTDPERDYVDKYLDIAAMIANDAVAARSDLDQAISGWDAAVAQADRTHDFARKAALEAIAYLDLRFINEGSSFCAYLLDRCNL